MKERRIIRTIIVNERKKYTSDRHSSRYGTGRDRAAKRPYRPCTGSDRPEYEGTKGTITTSRTTRRRVGVGAASFVSLFGSGCLGGLTGDDGYEHELDDPPCEWGGLYELESGDVHVHVSGRARSGYAPRVRSDREEQRTRPLSRGRNGDGAVRTGRYGDGGH